VSKQIIKSLATSVFAHKASASLLRPFWRGRSVIFVLHRLSARPGASDSMTLETIATSLAALRKAGARFVSLSHLVDLAVKGLEPEPGCVAFTIDDGYFDQGVMAKEGFIDNGVPVTVFLISGLVDGRTWPWDHQIEYAIDNSTCDTVEFQPTGTTLRLTSLAERNAAIDTVQSYCKSLTWSQAAQVLERLYAGSGVVTPPPKPPSATHRPLDWATVRDLEAAGVEFAPHSITHRITSRLTAEEAREEIQGSWLRLQQELARPVPIYAWPTGRAVDFCERDMNIAAEAGLRAAVSVTNDYAHFGNREGGRAARFSASRFAMSVSTLDTLQYGTGLERLKQLVRLG
jgi:peptidoglycan/xylan/chitin deacetylase (PgdA/CDA1 family)